MAIMQRLVPFQFPEKFQIVVQFKQITTRGVIHHGLIMEIYPFWSTPNQSKLPNFRLTFSEHHSSFVPYQLYKIYIFLCFGIIIIKSAMKNSIFGNFAIFVRFWSVWTNIFHIQNCNCRICGGNCH